MIGKGSNLLVADRGFDGLAITLEGDFAEVVVDAGQHRVRAGAGVALQSLARTTAGAGQRGLEFFVGIPGSVGGAVRMNAGGHGRETADVLIRAEVLTVGPGARPETRPVGALGLGYRTSNLGPGEIVVRRRVRGHAASPAECEESIAEIVRWRKEHQPGGSNGGSVFRNPPGDSAGRLIDELGLKGLRVGGAIVSPKHAELLPGRGGRDRRRRLPPDPRGAGTGHRRHRHRARARGPAGGVRRDRARRVHERWGSSMSAPARHTRRRRAAARTSRQPRPPRRPVDPRVRDRWVAARRDEGRRRLRILVVVASVITALALAWAVTVSPLLAVEQIDVKGNAQVTPAEVIAAAQVGEGDAMVWLDPGQVVTRLEASPWIRTATVTRDWPRTLVITVTERVPDGLGAGRRHGRSARRRPHRPCPRARRRATEPGLPQLVDVRQAAEPGGSIVPAQGAAVAAAYGLYAPAVAQISVTDGGAVVKLVSGPEVRLGRPTRLRTKLAAAGAVLDSLQAALPTYVDVSVPTNPVAG